MAKYLINKSTTNVSLMDGKVLVPVTGWAELSDKDADNDHVVEAIRRGWVTMQDESPDAAAAPFQANMVMGDPAVFGTTEFPKDKVKKIVSATTDTVTDTTI